MKLTKNHYHLKEMWAVIGTSGAIRALYNSKWHAGKSHRYGKNCTLKKVQVLIGNEQIEENNTRFPALKEKFYTELIKSLPLEVKKQLVGTVYEKRIWQFMEKAILDYM